MLILEDDLDPTTDAPDVEGDALVLPGPWQVGEHTLTLEAPRLPLAIRWQVQFQRLRDEVEDINDHEDLPDYALAAAGLCCPQLPDRARREDWLDYADRVSVALMSAAPSVPPLGIYNAAMDVLQALRGWLNQGPAQEDIEAMGNS